MNKKAGERVLSFYLMLILVLIVVSVVGAVIYLRGGKTDVRQAELEILKEDLSACLVENGRIASWLIDIEGDSISMELIRNRCGLMLDEEDFLFSIEIFEDCKEECSGLEKEYFFGSKEDIIYCKTGAKSKFFVCAKKLVDAYSDDKFLVLNLAIKKADENVK